MSEQISPSKSFAAVAARPSTGFDRYAVRPAWRVDTLTWLGLAVAICAALDAFHLGQASLWTDEIFSRYYFDVFGLHFLLTDGLQHEPTPPTHAILLRGWIAVFGDSEAALRAMSAVAYAACIPVVYWLARRFGAQRQAAAAALLFALSPFGLHFAQEARAYALTLAPTAVLLLACSDFLENRRPHLTAWLYVISGTACLYLHATLVFLVAASGMAVAGCLLLQHGVASWRLLLRWCALNVVVAVLALPYLVNLAGASQGGGLEWIGPLHVRDIVLALAAVTSGVLTPLPIAAPITAILFVALAWSVVRHRPATPMLVTTVLIPGLFFGLVVAVSLVRPILLPRIMCWTIVPFCVLLARQILVGGRLRFVVAAAAVLAFGAGLVTERTTPNAGKEPWRDVYADLAPVLHHADLIVLSPRSDPLTARYYGSGTRNVWVWDEHLPPTIMTDVATRIGVGTIGREQILAAIAAGQKVVAISNAIDVPYLGVLNDRYPAGLVKQWACGRANCIEAMAWGPTENAAASAAAAP